jgi:hypothetical protein
MATVDIMTQVLLFQMKRFAGNVARSRWSLGVDVAARKEIRLPTCAGQLREGPMSPSASLLLDPVSSLERRAAMALSYLARQDTKITTEREWQTYLAG